MEKSKRKNGDINLRRCWLFFVPFTLFMTFMVPHPIRFGIGELSDDGLLYGVIALLCLVAAVYIFRRAGKRSRRLIALILLCAGFAAWQPFDIFVLRMNTRSGSYGFGTGVDEQHGYAVYFTHLRSIPDCKGGTVEERYFGNYRIAITLEIRWHGTPFVCGG